MAELAQSDKLDISSGPELIRGRELIFQHEVILAGSDEFMFKHSLLRDVTEPRAAQVAKDFP